MIPYGNIFSIKIMVIFETTEAYKNDNESS